MAFENFNKSAVKSSMFENLEITASNCFVLISRLNTFVEQGPAENQVADA